MRLGVQDIRDPSVTKPKGFVRLGSRSCAFLSLESWKGRARLSAAEGGWLRRRCSRRLGQAWRCGRKRLTLVSGVWLRFGSAPPPPCWMTLLGGTQPKTRQKQLISKWICYVSVLIWLVVTVSLCIIWHVIVNMGCVGSCWTHFAWYRSTLRW